MVTMQEDSNTVNASVSLTHATVQASTVADFDNVANQTVTDNDGGRQ